jgi:hypothetical protein
MRNRVIGWSDPSMSTLRSSITSGRTVGVFSTTVSGAASSGTSSSGKVETYAKTQPIGAIVGGVVGGIALLGVVIAAWYLMHRSRRKKYRY